MVILGVLLLVVTLMYPPYYGRGGADESDTSLCKSNNTSVTSSESDNSSESDSSIESDNSSESDNTDKSKGKRWYERTGANRLRLAIDLGMLWTYICALVAILLHTNTSHEIHEGTPLSHSAIVLECYSAPVFMIVAECGVRGALTSHA